MDVSWVTDDLLYTAWRQRGHTDVIHAVTEIQKDTKSHQVGSKFLEAKFLLHLSEQVSVNVMPIYGVDCLEEFVLIKSSIKSNHQSFNI